MALPFFSFQFFVSSRSNSFTAMRHTFASGDLSYLLQSPSERTLKGSGIEFSVPDPFSVQANPSYHCLSKLYLH